jgi:hypothetical protein
MLNRHGWCWVLACAAGCGGAESGGGAEEPAPSGWTAGGSASAADVPVVWPLADGARRVEGAGFAISIPNTWDELAPSPPIVYQARVLEGGSRLLMLSVSAGPPGMDASTASQVGRDALANDGWQVSTPQRLRLGDMQAIEFTMSQGVQSMRQVTFSRLASTGTIGAMAGCMSAEIDHWTAQRACLAILDTLRLGPEATQYAPSGTRLLRARGATMLLPADWIELPPDEGGLLRATSRSEPMYSVIMISESMFGSTDAYFERSFRDLARETTVEDRRPSRAGSARAVDFQMIPVTGELAMEQRVRYVDLESGTLAFSCGGSAAFARSRPEICNAILDSIRPTR